MISAAPTPTRAACSHFPKIAAKYIVAACIVGAGAITAPSSRAAEIPPPSIDSIAKHVYLLDVSTGTILLEKNARTAMAPASMSKLMTLYMAFERLKDGRLKLSDTFPVSTRAWRKGGSKMFVRVNTRVSVEDLLRGVIVQSGNDACIVIAEGISGDEDAFADAMTRRAREIGLADSSFANATGWPDPRQRMSARDIAELSAILIRDYPEYYAYFRETEFVYNKIRQPNRNPLLSGTKGADGLKTGHTEESGYGLAASAVRDDRRLVLVVNGLSSKRTRASESRRLLEWGFRTFGSYPLFKAGEKVDEAAVWLGESATVPLVVDQDVRLSLPRAARRNMKVKVLYQGPIAAPIAKGAPVARIQISAPGYKTREIPLVAGSDIAQKGFVGRIGAAVRFVLLGRSG